MGARRCAAAAGGAGDNGNVDDVRGGGTWRKKMATRSDEGKWGRESGERGRVPTTYDIATITGEVEKREF